MELQVASILWLQQHLHPGADRFFEIVTFFGGFSGVVILTAFVCWGLSYRIGAALLLTNLLVQYVGSLWLKAAIALPRPFQTFPTIFAIAPEQGFSFPSGHAINAIMTLGTIAWCIRRTRVTILLGIGIALIGVSRLYLGVHYPTDLLGGYLLGGLGLWAMRWTVPLIAAWATRTGCWHRVVRCAAVGTLLAGLLVLWGPVGIPWRWGLFACLIYVGACAGILLQAGRHGMAMGPAGQNVRRLAIGYAVLLPLLLGFPRSPMAYLAATLWVTAGAPWLFQRIGPLSVAVARRRVHGCVGLLLLAVGGTALPRTALAYDSAELIIHTAKREGRPLETRRWALEPQRCRRLIDFTGTAERCTVHATANGMAAIVSLVTSCGGDVCDGQSYLSLAKAKPLLLPDALWGGGLELLPSLRVLVADHVDLNERTRRVEASLVQYDIKTASTTRFAACESPTLSPQGRWIVCRHADGDVLRVSAKGGRPQRVFRTQVKPTEAYRAPHSWALHPPVEFPTPTQMRIPTQLQNGELRTEQTPWTE